VNSGARTPPSLRLSTVRDCPRRAVLEALGAPMRDLSEHDRRILFRGKEIGRVYATMLAAGAQNSGGKWRIFVGSGPADAWPSRWLTTNPEDARFIAEKRVPWKHGVGHCDLLDLETNVVLEVLSSASPTADMRLSKLVQAVLYAEHMPATLGVCLRVVNPSDFSDEQIVQLKGSPEYDATLAVARERLAAVDEWAVSGKVPDCTGEANAWFCRLDDCPCKQPAPPLEVVDTAEARRAALTFAQAKAAESSAKAVYESAKLEREAAQILLAPLVPVGKIAVGPYEVSRIRYAPRKTFQLALAEKDSRIDSDLLAEFTKVGSEYDVLKIQRVSDETALSAEEFGAVPF
jgi:hypothetical protein